MLANWDRYKEARTLTAACEPSSTDILPVECLPSCKNHRISHELQRDWASEIVRRHCCHRSSRPCPSSPTRIRDWVGTRYFRETKKSVKKKSKNPTTTQTTRNARKKEKSILTTNDCCESDPKKANETVSSSSRRWISSPSLNSNSNLFSFFFPPLQPNHKRQHHTPVLPLDHQNPFFFPLRSSLLKISPTESFAFCCYQASATQSPYNTQNHTTPSMHCICSCSSFPAAAAAGPCSTTECDNNCIPHTVYTRINTHTPEEQESLCDTNQTGQKQAKCMQQKNKNPRSSCRRV